MPCNVVATKSGIVNSINLYQGLVTTTVGSGVVAGDILISGVEYTEPEDKNSDDLPQTKYCRADGIIMESFEECVTFFQPFEDYEKIITDNTSDYNYITLFDFSCPLFLRRDKGNYVCSYSQNNFSVYDIDFPICIITVSQTEYVYAICTYTQEQAQDKLYAQLEKYEANFYGDYEINNRSVSLKVKDDGIEITANYDLYGEIGKQVDIYINK